MQNQLNDTSTTRGELIDTMEIAGTTPLNSKLSIITKNTDVLMGFATMCILMVMIIPIPPMMLDLFLKNGEG